MIAKHLRPVRKRVNGPLTEEHKAAIGKANTGRVFTAAQRANMRASALRRPKPTAQARFNMRKAALRRKPPTAETCAKISAIRVEEWAAMSASEREWRGQQISKGKTRFSLRK